MDQHEYDLKNRELQQRQWETEYNTKAAIEAQGYKGLGLINGGAAVALGALLQAVINKPEAVSVVPFILSGIVFNIAGITAASIIFWVRYNQWVYEKQYDKFMKDNPWWAWRWYLAGISLLCFVVGMGVAVWGGFTRLNLASAPVTAIQVAPPSPASSKTPSNKSLNPDAQKRRAG